MKLLGKDDNENSKDTSKLQVSAITAAGIGNNDEEPMTAEQHTNAQIYYQLLKQKMHKSFSKAHKENLKKKDKEGGAKKSKEMTEDLQLQSQ